MDHLLQLAISEQPLFRTIIDKKDLQEMIIDALRFRVKWAELERGVLVSSPALNHLVSQWDERCGAKI